MLPARADDKTADEVKKVDRALTDAMIKGDVKEVDRLPADDYLHTSPNGRIYDKKHILGAGFRDRSTNFARTNPA
jgi:hypothetical protein